MFKKWIDTVRNHDNGHFDWLFHVFPLRESNSIISDNGKVSDLRSYLEAHSLSSDQVFNSTKKLFKVQRMDFFDSHSESLSFPRSSKLVFQFWLLLRFTAGRWDSTSLNFDSFYHWSLQFACGRSNRRLSIIFQLQTGIVIN